MPYKTEIQNKNLQKIVIYRQDIQVAICKQQEYNKRDFLQLCNTFQIENLPIAVSEDIDNSMRGRASCSVLDHFKKRVIFHQYNDLIDVIKRGTFRRKFSRKHNLLSFLDQLYHRIQSSSTPFS